jgi:HlyD family secretion protein
MCRFGDICWRWVLGAGFIVDCANVDCAKFSAKFSTMQIPMFGAAKKNKRLYGVIGLLAAGIVAVPLGFYLTQQRGKSADNVEALTIPVQLEDVTQRIKGTGKIQPVRTVNVSPKSAGRVVELLVDQGDRVTEGQVVARMDAQDLRSERDQAVANLAAARAKLVTLQDPTRSEAVGQADAGVAQAEARLDQARSETLRIQADVNRAQSEKIRIQGVVKDAESRLELAEKQLKRQQALAQQGAIAQNNLDEFVQKAQSARQSLSQAQAQFAQAAIQIGQAERQVTEASLRVDQSDAQRRSAAEQRQQQNIVGSPGEIRQAEAQVSAALAQLQAVENRIADTEIRAPFAGLVTQRYATIGAFVTPTTQASATGTGATSTSIFGIASGLEVLASVPERDIAQIKRGQEVEISVDAYPKESFKGKVRLIAPEAIEEQNVTKFQVRLDLTSGVDLLKSGMNVDLNFAGEQLNQAIAVPSVAIVTKRGKPGVLVPGKDGAPTFKPVKIGVDLDNKTQILAGLSAGDRIFKELPPGKKLEDVLKASGSDKSSGGDKSSGSDKSSGGDKSSGESDGGGTDGKKKKKL